MIKRILLLGLLCGLLAGSSGCGCLNSILYCPFGPGTLCADVGAPCGDPCGDPCGGCDVGCDTGCATDCGFSCGEPCEVGCEQTCDTPCEVPCGLLTPLFNLLQSRTWCGPVCGETYLGDFHGNPPNLFDPCDNHGQYTGCNSCVGSGCATGHATGCTSCGTPVYDSAGTTAPITVEETPTMAELQSDHSY